MSPSLLVALLVATGVTPLSTERGGTLGVNHTAAARALGMGRLTLGISAEAFAASDFLVDGDHHVGTSERLTVAVGVWDYLDLFASQGFRYDQNDAFAQATQTLGNPIFGVKGAYPLGDALAAGLMVDLLLPTSAAGKGLAAHKARTRILALASFQPVEVLAVNLAAGYSIASGQQLYPYTLTALQQYGSGLDNHSAVVASLAVQGNVALGSKVILIPWVEGSLDAAVGVDIARSPSHLSAGLKLGLGAGQELELGGGVDIAMSGTPRGSGPLPGTPRWQGLLRIGVRLDPTAEAKTDGPKNVCTDNSACATPNVCIDGACVREKIVEKRVEVPVEREVVKAPPTFLIAGRIVDAVSGNGITAATVQLSVGETSPLSTDANGRFRTWAIERNDGLMKIAVSAAGFRAAEETLSRNPQGDVANVELRLNPEGRPDMGTLKGSLKNARSGAVVQGKITVVQLKKVVKVDATGAFSIEVKPGTYDLDVRASGFEGQRKKVEVAAGSVVILNLDLEPGR